MDLMKAFLQGAAYSWAKNMPEQAFALRDLMGGENWEWRETPLYPLFLKHQNKGKSNADAMIDAAKDAGWILKEVLSADKRTFRVAARGLTNGYTWVGNEP